MGWDAGHQTSYGRTDMKVEIVMWILLFLKLLQTQTGKIKQINSLAFKTTDILFYFMQCHILMHLI